MSLTLDDHSQKIPWIVFLLLTFIFFLINGHNFYFSQLEHYDQSADFFIKGVEEGNIYRRIGIYALGLFAVLSFISNPVMNLKINHFYGWLILLFAAWCLASILWSIEISLTLRKLMVFIVFWLAALALVNRYSIEVIPYCTLFISGVFLTIGLLSEIVLGTFHPFDPDYRFMGTVHPNVQGVNCALMLVSATVIAGKPGRTNYYALLLRAIALVALFLTKSRTSFASAILSIIFLWLLASPPSRKKILILSFIWLLIPISLLSAFTDYNLIYLIISPAHLGRDSLDVGTLNSRTEIWSICSDYIFKRPLLGYGFNSFWTSQNIYTLSSQFGAGLSTSHSVYLEIVLNIGFIGATIFIFIIMIGIIKSFSCFKQCGIIGYSFYFVFFTFFALDGLMESQLNDLGFGNFLLLWGIAGLAYLPFTPKEFPSFKVNCRAYCSKVRIIGTTKGNSRYKRDCYVIYLPSIERC